MIINNDNDRYVFLELIVTHYREQRELFMPFFEMLILQRMVRWNDIRVTVIQDGEDTANIYGELEAYDPVPQQQFMLRVIQVPHGGVSAARNKGIDIANAEWIMFCDCDDSFYSRYSLYDIQQVYNTYNHDILDGRYISENCYGSREIKPGVEMPGNAWNHGKLYRLDFLRENGLRFPEDLVLCEDEVFNTKASCACAEGRHGSINETIAPWYVWVYRQESTSHNYYTQDDATRCSMEKIKVLMPEYLKHSSMEEFLHTVCGVFYEFYYHITASENREKLTRLFKPIYDGYIDYFRKCDKDECRSTSDFYYEKLKTILTDLKDDSGLEAWLDELKDLDTEQKNKLEVELNGDQ